MFSQKGMSGHCQNLSHRHDDGQATDTWCPGITRQITQRCEYLQIHSQKWKEFQCMMIRPRIFLISITVINKYTYYMILTTF